MSRDMDKFITRAESVKIWTYMGRFPLYEDLKELNNKFLPELAKVEQCIANFTQDQKNMREMI